MSTRYSVRKSFMWRSWYVYDHIEMEATFYGTYDECQMWIDDPIGLALQQTTKLAECFNDEKEG